MKKLLLSLLLPATMTAHASEPITPEAITQADVMSVQGSQTYTYVRCWYRTHFNHNDPATKWEWALDDNNEYFTIDGYWYSSISFKNMFYTQTSQDEIAQRCKTTLGVDHEAADISFYAADHGMSYNHSIWTNDAPTSANTINRMVAFGDSLSDTNNMFNASLWRFPNPNSWFLGRFSNGLVWTEYLARDKNIPLYNWAVGGAAGSNQYLALTGVTEQVTSYLTYMKMATNYQPSRTLFTLEFGLNDFMNYNRSVDVVKTDFDNALVRLTDAGAENIMLFTLPDATKAPQFKYSTQEEIEKVRAKIVLFNEYIREQALLYRMKGLNVALVDANQLFEQLTQNPQKYGFENASDACLNINRSSAMDYLYKHSLTNECAYHGSDKYVFWGVTHPTTATHKFIADNILSGVMSQFNF
ncbi:thermolabile hemolysin [Photobacterium jeanii]|uniref:Thermolabile hemolysin n=1 Tax=Photobacterium jeanii TaxID=858640 RepID=A0A178KKR1_9GAMM|nr:SGNH/GDSL hydrolase family protein [Photobacterium jeanii]OAN17968.1 thermolabile hemolysin [Photobacterium jeanii]PST92362.1 thermolabile hemolysin [Photobacterium jeanii]